MEKHIHLPSGDRLSIVTATILLAYALSPYIQTPRESINIQLPGFLLQLPLNLNTLIAFIAGGLAAAGTDWLISSHPLIGSQRASPHLFIPALTAMVISVPLSSLQMGPYWWAVFTLGGLMLVLVMVAEYITLDMDDSRHAFTSVALTSVSFALQLILVIAVRGAGFRLYMVLAAIIPTTGLVVLRALNLRLNGKWSVPWALGISLLIGQLGLGLFYLPLHPLSYGLILTGSTYALTSIAGSLEEKKSWKSLWVEPVIMVVAMSILAWLFG